MSGAGYGDAMTMPLFAMLTTFLFVFFGAGFLGYILGFVRGGDYVENLNE